MNLLFCCLETLLISKMFWDLGKILFHYVVSNSLNAALPWASAASDKVFPFYSDKAFPF